MHQPTPTIERTSARPDTYRIAIEEASNGDIAPACVDLAAFVLAAQTAAAFLQIEVALYRMRRG